MAPTHYSCEESKFIKSNKEVCSRCHVNVILIDTEEWDKPLCDSCYVYLGEPESEVL